MTKKNKLYNTTYFGTPTYYEKNKVEKTKLFTNCPRTVNNRIYLYWCAYIYGEKMENSVFISRVIR